MRWASRSHNFTTPPPSSRRISPAAAWDQRPPARTRRPKGLTREVESQTHTAVVGADGHLRKSARPLVDLQGCGCPLTSS
jgi:hypothetical protein